MEGLAWVVKLVAGSSLLVARGVGVGVWAAKAAGAGGCSFGAESTVGAGGTTAGTSAAGTLSTASPLASISAISAPSETLSLTLTLSSLTTPENGDGTSMVALSVSSVMSESFAFTVSPILTITSMISTSLKLPMSGTRICLIVPIA